MTAHGPRLALGLDIGGSSVKAALLSHDSDGTPRTVATDIRALAPSREISHAIDVVESLAVDLSAAHGGGDSIGVALPGIFDPVSGSATVLPNFPAEWLGYPIRDVLEQRIGQRLHLVNDAKAFAFAEARMGAGAGHRTVACVVLGTGVGGGIVIDGELWSGQGTAGELGHLTVELSGPLCGCGNNGCVEAFAGAEAIAKRGHRSTAEEVFDAAALGDPRAAEAVEAAVSAVAAGLANVFITAAPDIFVIGGGIAGSADRILEPLIREVRRRVRVAPPEQIRVVRGALGRQAGAVGAALLATIAFGPHQLKPEGVT